MSDSLREALRKLVYRIRQRSTNKLHNREYAMTLDDCVRELAALSAQQADAEPVFLGSPDSKAVAARLRGYANEAYHSEVAEVPRSVLFEAAQLLTAPPSQSAVMRKALESEPRALLAENSDERRMFDESCARLGMHPLEYIACGLYAERNLTSVPGASYYEQRTIAFNELHKAVQALSRADEGKESEGGEDPFVHGAEDEAYALGRHDGYESAIQDTDLATGGDGEFKGSTIPGETVDVMAMKARIIARFADEGTKSEGGVISAARNALLRVDTWSDAKKDYAERAMKSEGGVEGHADPASGGKCLDVKATDPRGNIDGDATCVVRQAADRQKANGAGVESGPSDPTPPDRREAWPNEWNLRREAERRVKELEGNTPKFQRDGDSYLICEGHHHVDEPCEFERYVPEARAETAERRVAELEVNRDALAWAKREEARAETDERYERLYNDEVVERLRAERKLAEARAALKALYQDMALSNDFRPDSRSARVARAVIEKE